MSFERVCLLHTKQLKAALEIAGISSQDFSWQSKKAGKGKEKGEQNDLLIAVQLPETVQLPVTDIPVVNTVGEWYTVYNCAEGAC